MKYINTPPTLRIIYFIIGCLMVLCGMAGVILPIVPTVPFLLVASWCFMRSSPRFHDWIQNHKIFGPPLQQWEKYGVIRPFIKFLAIAGMFCGFCSFTFFIKPPLWLALLVIAILLAISAYILTRPSYEKS